MGVDMKQLSAFTKKEFLEQIRTGKLLLLGIIFCLFGIMNPAIAKLTPWMMEILSSQLAESGMIVTEVRVNDMTSWTQFFKNMPMVLMIFIVMFSGCLTTEYQKGTLLNMITKGMKRWKIIASKTAVIMVLWVSGCLLSFGITLGYNAYFWGNDTVQNIEAAAGFFCLFGLWILAALIMASALCRQTFAVILGTGAAYLGAYLIGMFPPFKPYSPSCLLDSAGLLTGANSAGDYLWAVFITILLMFIQGVVAITAFNRKTCL